MHSDPLRITLDTLRSESDDTELRASQLKGQLDTVTQRLRHLRGAIENIEALLGAAGEDSVPSHLEDGVRAPQERIPLGATHQVIDFSTVDDVDPSLRKRVPSTDWVADVVNTIGRPADRDTIYAKFEEMKGIPMSWVANPRNSFNNALGRAVVRRMILKYGENEFAPAGYNPSADEYSDPSEEQR